MRIKFFMLALVFMFLTACGGTPADVGDDVPVVPYDEIEPESPETIEEPETFPKIAVITHETYSEQDWLTQLIKRHGTENVIIYTWPGRNLGITDWINGIAQNPELKVLIINPGRIGTDYKIDTLREQRDDIFISYFNDNIDKNANLILEVNHSQMVENFPAKAQEMGAETLIYFYDTSWWEEDISEYIESNWHSMLRKKSEELGLLFIPVDIGGAIQCGSSTAAYMSETIPPLMEKYGTNTVLFGLCSERLFWSRGHGYIYLPMYQAWFEPAPYHIAYELEIISPSEKEHHISYLIEGIRSVLEERNALGHVASFPMSKQVLFPLAAIEYGLKWVAGEVPQEGIDIAVLEQIMLEIIAEYTGLEWSAGLTTLVENDVTYENHILVLLDYLVY